MYTIIDCNWNIQGECTKLVMEFTRIQEDKESWFEWMFVAEELLDQVPSKPMFVWEEGHETSHAAIVANQVVCHWTNSSPDELKLVRVAHEVGHFMGVYHNNMPMYYEHDENDVVVVTPEVLDSEITAWEYARELLGDRWSLDMADYAIRCLRSYSELYPLSRDQVERVQLLMA